MKHKTKIKKLYLCFELSMQYSNSISFHLFQIDIYLKKSFLFTKFYYAKYWFNLPQKQNITSSITRPWNRANFLTRTTRPILRCACDYVTRHTTHYLLQWDALIASLGLLINYFHINLKIVIFMQSIFLFIFLNHLLLNKKYKNWKFTSPINVKKYISCQICLINSRQKQWPLFLVSLSSNLHTHDILF